MNTKINFLRKPIILTSLSSGIMCFILPIYCKFLGMNALEITGLSSIISLILILMRPFMGKAVDKFGRKSMLLLSLIISIIYYIIFAYANTSELIYTARIIEGIASALMGISISSILIDNSDENNFSESFGYINSFNSNGYILGTIVAFVVLSKFDFLEGWKFLFIIFAIAAIMAAFFVIRDVPENNKFIKSKVNTKSLSLDAKKLLLIVLLIAIAGSMLSSIFMIFMLDKFSNDVVSLAYVFFPALIFQSLFSGKIGEFSDKLGRKNSMILGLISDAIITIFIAFSSSTLILTILWTINSLLGVLYNVSEQAMYSKFTNTNPKGEMFGIYGLVCSLGSIVGPITGGFIYDNISPYLVFYLYGASMIIATILISVLIRSDKVIQAFDN